MKREYKGNAAATSLTNTLGGATSDVQIFGSDLTNWPTGLGGKPFFVVIDRGKSNEEKILCSSRTGNMLTVFNDGITNGRGADDTSVTSHMIGASLEHVFTATDASEANDHVNSTTNVHGVADFTALADKTYADAAAAAAAGTVDTALTAHTGATTGVHGIADTAGLAKTADVVGKTNGKVTIADPAQTVVRNITLSTLDPSGGTDGDVWLKYV